MMKNYKTKRFNCNVCQETPGKIKKKFKMNNKDRMIFNTEDFLKVTFMGIKIRKANALDIQEALQ